MTVTRRSKKRTRNEFDFRKTQRESETMMDTWRVLRKLYADTAEGLETLEEGDYRSLPTRFLAALAGQYKLVERRLSPFVTSCVSELKRRAGLKKRDPEFSDIEKHRAVIFDDFRAVVQTREIMKERPEALEWLKGKASHGLFMELTKPNVQVTDAERFAAALLRGDINALRETVTIERQLNRRSIEDAVAAGRVTKQVIGKLYSIETTYAFVVDDDLDDKDGG